VRIAVDFDGTIVERDHFYEDATSPLVFRPGAREALHALRRAGHTLLLWSSRPARAVDDPSPLNDARLRQMLDLVARELPGVFDDVVGGSEGKPAVDLFVDDKAVRLGDDLGGFSWGDVARTFGEPADAPRVPVAQADRERWADAVRGWGDVARGTGARLTRYGRTAAGDLVALDLANGGAALLVVAGQHGEERSGPVMLRLYAEELLEKARALGVRLVVVPCANPEGWDARSRYNSRGERPTNAFLRYQLDGSPRWVGEVPPGQRAAEVKTVQDDRRARETAALARFVSSLGLRAGFSVLDLHEDAVVPEYGAFAYVFGDSPAYAALAARSGAVPYAGALKNDSWTDLSIQLRSDARGLVVDFQDGTLTDWARWRGASLSACLECSTRGLAASVGVAREWAVGMVEMAAVAGQVGRDRSTSCLTE
jgi:hypothetical protein